MQSRLRILICLAAAALILAACSSTTVVARDDRATSTGQSSDAESSDASSENDTSTSDDSTDTTGTADAPESGDDTDADDDSERGGRDDTPTPRDIDIAEGFGLGGAEQLESLLVDCQDGNDLACDILFQISAFDSEEEIAALTCGGRSDVEVVFCTDGIEAGDDELVFDPSSDALDRIIQACQDEGNMTACDFLYYRSPINSEFQEIGGTCGGRVNVAIPDCRSAVEE